MITHTNLVTVLRFFNDEFAIYGESQYDAICTLAWERNDVVWMTGLHGTLSMCLMRQLVVWLLQNNVRMVKADRAGRKIPLGQIVGDHIELVTADVAKRFGITKEAQ